MAFSTIGSAIKDFLTTTGQMPAIFHTVSFEVFRSLSVILCKCVLTFEFFREITTFSFKHLSVDNLFSNLINLMQCELVTF